METDNAVDHDASQIRLQHELDEVAKTLDLTPEGIEATALRALYRGLCKIRLEARENPALVYSLADAMHNLPIALQKKDYDSIRMYTIEAVHAQRRRPATVTLLYGAIGSGKTTLVLNVASAQGLRMKHVNPSHVGEQLPPQFAWNEIDCLAVDEVQQWGQVNIEQTVQKLEREAIAHGKKLVLLMQDGCNLVAQHIQSKPFVIRMSEPNAAARLAAAFS